MSELAQQVGEALKAQGLMLATAESCTGGGIAQALTDISGSSAWFERGFVTYANAAKVEMLGVRQSTLDAHGAVSAATVREMVAGALAHSHAHIAVAVSGVAGPTGGTPEKPVGTVWFGWASRNSGAHARLHQLSGDRAAVRAQSVDIALQGVLDLLASRTETA
ncbi:MAG: CinA family protein [Gallionellaceae bacterium]|nr:MAG: CinA family protein [Gallionellaceae bacterium]